MTIATPSREIGLARKKTSNSDLRCCASDPIALCARIIFPAVGSRSYELGECLADISETGASGLSILVVESDATARGVLVDHLRRHGFRIVESEHGGPAIRTAIDQHFDYIVADIDWLGVSDGATLARLTRTSRPDTRLILTSTTLSHWFTAGSTMAGIPMIRKPFKQEDLDRFLVPLAVTAVPGS